jgi:quercetin dioxygenase-like cupin family protein
MEVLIGSQDGAPNFALRHFVVEPGGHTPRHAHNYEHEVVMLEGRARVEQGEEFAEVSSGDVLLIRPNQVHQFVNTGDGPLRFLCLVPVTYDCGTPTPGA